MRELFAVVRERALAGDAWVKVPLGFTAPELEPPWEAPNRATEDE
jgi:hypothetical protein